MCSPERRSAPSREVGLGSFNRQQGDVLCGMATRFVTVLLGETGRPGRNTGPSPPKRRTHSPEEPTLVQVESQLCCLFLTHRLVHVHSLSHSASSQNVPTPELQIAVSKPIPFGLINPYWLGFRRHEKEHFITQWVRAFPSSVGVWRLSPASGFDKENRQEDRGSTID